MINSAAPSTIPLGSIATTLSSDDLALLRAGYEASAQQGHDMPIDGMAALVEASRALVTPLMDRYFSVDKPPAMAPDRRELVLLGTTALLGQGAGANFATHIYWALVAGIDPPEIADTLLLIGYYAGIPLFNNAARTTQRALDVIQAQLASARDPSGQIDLAKCSVAAVVGAISAAFPVYPPPAP